MSKYKNTIIYVIIISIFTLMMFLIGKNGSALELERNIPKVNTDISSFDQFIDNFSLNVMDPLAILLAQIVTIILASRMFGWLFMKIGQPSVIGEIIAGIVLGPSLLGLFFPETFEALFPVQSLGNLKFISQIGLLLFMFVIGMELDLKVLKTKASDAVVISHASIVIPFALGMLLAYYTYETYAPENINFISYALFCGIAMSITAFPVLARIVQERQIHKTRLGTLVLTCAAADDITAWCLLAGVIAIVKAGSFTSALYIIGFSVLYVIFMLNLVKPFLKHIGDLFPSRDQISKPVVGVVILTMLISSYLTEIIGIHALFGAFMVGVIMPEKVSFRNTFVEKVEDVALVLLLPLFFVYTGLKTKIGLINTLEMWEICGIIILVAIIGKFIGSAFTARLVGHNWKDSLTIGALMNTRGLMELIVLNIGLELGVISEEIFAMMVIMALTTTFMTGPALNLINRIFKNSNQSEEHHEILQSQYKLLVSFTNSETGISLLKIAHGLTNRLKEKASLTALHVISTTEVKHFSLEQYEEETFKPIIEKSEELNQKLTTLFKASLELNSDILELSNEGEYDLVLVEIGKSIFEGTFLGRILGFTTRIINPGALLNKFTGKEKIFDNDPFDETTRNLLNKVQVPLGVFLDKDLKNVKQIFVPILTKKDAFLVSFIQKFIHNSDSKVIIYDPTAIIKTNYETEQNIKLIEKIDPNHIQILQDLKIEKEFLKQNDLMLMSLDSWESTFNNRSKWLKHAPSTLILRM